MRIIFSGLRGRGGKRTIPYYVIGNGGHGLTRLSIDTTLRTPISLPIFAQPELGDTVVLNNYDYQEYGVSADPGGCSAAAH